MGAFFSILIVAVTISYAYQKMDLLVNRKDVDILSTIRDSYYDHNYQFNN